MRDDCFFRRVEDDLYESTPWTRGPWSDAHQHAGPPSALLAGRLASTLDASFRVARVSIEVTREVPIAPLRLEHGVRRDGRTVKALQGRLLDPDGRVVLTADLLAISEAPLDVGPTPTTMDEAGPEESRAVDFLFRDEEPGYANAMELRFGRGNFGDGDVMAWMRMRVALLEGARPSSLERVLAAADSGNGVSQRLSMNDYLYMNPDLTVTLHRPLRGEWVGLSARTDFDALGVGMADTKLYDASGPIGRGIQTLFVRKRG
jgi:hypothetical protein